MQRSLEIEFKQMPIILRNPPQRIVEPPRDLDLFHGSSSVSGLQLCLTLGAFQRCFNLPAQTLVGTI